MSDENEEKKPKTNELDRAFTEGFEYTGNKNPYHDRLKVFDTFVLRDDEAEVHCGSWNSDVFKRDAELACEIGTGYGHFMMDYTQKNSNVNFVGLDHRFKRSFHLAKKLDSLQHKSFRYLRGRGERLGFMFGENELDKVFYFFPDPWPKTRHHKKRLFQKRFLDEAHKVLKADGLFLIKTDHDGYYQWMLDVIKDETRFEVVMQTWDLREEQPDHFLASFVTKFEKIFMEKGIKIKALVLKNIK